jgi:hypothetical protein
MNYKPQDQEYSSGKPVNVIVKNNNKELEKDVSKEVNTDTVYQEEFVLQKKSQTKVKAKIRKKESSKKWVKKNISTTKKDMAKVSREKKIENNLWKLPRTRKEAEYIAKKIHSHCKNLIQLNRNDSLYLYAKHGLSMYENSSLFYVKAYALFHKKHYEEAIEACHIAKTRNDFWNDEERKKAVSVELKSLISINNKYPSRITKQKIEELLSSVDKSFY